MAIPGDRIQLFLYSVTAEEAEEKILRYLRERPGQLVKMWPMLNVICEAENWEDNRLERKFYLAQLSRLRREGKIIRYRTLLHRGCIRISEAYV